MFRPKKALFTLAMILLFMFVMVGCGANEQGVTGQTEEKNQEQATENQNVRVIEHAMGKTEIKGTPKRRTKSLRDGFSKNCVK